MKYGALEAGGTKMVLSMVGEDGTLLNRITLPTLSPSETMPDMVRFFADQRPDALGIGCFGPLDLNPDSPTYGNITTTPKLAWRQYPLLRTFVQQLKIPVGIDTDVNAAALAEQQLGAAKGLSSCLYVTIGTGVGGGLILNGKPVHGLVHPEFGHILLRPEPTDSHPDGYCPYHKGCLEGLAAGPAIQKRWGKPAPQLPVDHPAWALEAEYLAQMCCNAMMSFSPEKIILGGGVMHQRTLLPAIRKRTVELLGNYVSHSVVENGLEDYIVAPGLGENSGVLGAYLLAKQALNSQD